MGRDCRLGKTKNKKALNCQGGADHYKPPLAFYCYFLVLQCRTVFATETVTGTSSFAISQLSRVKVGLHDRYFTDFRINCAQNRKSLQFRLCTSLASRLMTVVFGLGMRLRVHMCTKLENDVLSNCERLLLTRVNLKR